MRFQVRDPPLGRHVGSFGQALRAPTAASSSDGCPDKHVCPSLLAAQSKRYYTEHPSITPQLVGYGAPRPSEASNEEPLIKGRMRTYPDQHPSLGSVPNTVANGCPAIVHKTSDSSMWKSTTRSTIDLKEPTLKNRKEGKAQPSALAGQSELYTPPLASYVAPPGAPDTIYRDQRVSKHMGTLTRSGRW